MNASGSRAVTLSTAKTSKERKISLRKVNRAEVEVIHVVAEQTEVLFADAVGPTAHHVVVNIR